jgi:type III secretion system FlhB-like substrate exporter
MKFETFQVPLASSNIVVKLLPGTKISKEIVERLYFYAQKFFKLKMILDERAKKLEKLREKIIEIAQKNGIRGIENDEFYLNVVVKEKVDWDVEKLKELLGNYSPLVVTEEIKIIITLPGNQKNLSSLARKIERSIENMGIPQEWVRVEENFQVNEERLSQIPIDVSSAKISKFTFAIYAGNK